MSDTPDFTRKHYIAIADIIAHSLTIEELTDNFVTYLKNDNYNFNANKFVEAISKNRKLSIQQVIPT